MTDVKTEPASVEPPSPPSSPPSIGAVGLARWAWRQLTSMKTALILLFLLALGAMPGSLIPQVGIDPLKVSDFYEAHPALAPWYDRLGLFDVYKLGLVLGDLPAAVHLVDRLCRAAAQGLPEGRPRPSAEAAAQPSSACRATSASSSTTTRTPSSPPPAPR